MKKLDPRLEHLLTQPVHAEFAERVGVTAPAAPQPVEVLIRCRRDTHLDKLRDLGVKVRSVTRGESIVVSGEIALADLPMLSQVEFVRRVESSRILTRELDISRLETRAEFVHQPPHSRKGNGVVVGIVDGGIDFTHPDFRNADGSSRILLLWDQGGVLDPNGNVPYGREYSKAELDAALQLGDPFSAVPHQDQGAHGTHVAGIAAGNGAAGGQFTGIAPESDLIIVSLETEGGVSLGRSVRAFEAVTYIVDRAAGQPVAINMSQGMNGGGHSGETLLETGMDNLAKQNGVAIVKSAGNEQTWRIHAGGQISEGQQTTLQFLVASNNRFDDVLELWYRGDDRISVAIKPPGSALSGFFATDTNFQTSAGNNIGIIFDPNADDTGDTLITFLISRGSALWLQPGTWSLVLRGDHIVTGRYDVWIERVYRSGGGVEQLRFTEASSDPTATISIPGTARHILTVGSYIVRDSVPGQISDFSSRGPTRYGIQKPELAAPGESIISARSSTANVPPDPDAAHTSMGGTSMAAPHVAGAAALVLSVQPALNCEQVKQILMRACRRDGFSATAPDNAWGNGKMDVLASIELAQSVKFPLIQNPKVNGTQLTWTTDIPTTSAVRFNINTRRLQLGLASDSVAELVLNISHSVSLSHLPSGKYYCEILAFSNENWWSSDDNGGAYYVIDVP